MPGSTVASWTDLGRRVAEGRSLAGVTQAELASRMGVDRTAVTRIESGDRRLDAIELVRLSNALSLPLDWFLTESSPVLASRRDRRLEAPRHPGIEIALERLVRDVELLAELGDLQLPDATPLAFPSTVADAERAADEARAAMGVATGPVLELGRHAGSLGLLLFGLRVDDAADFDGAYVALSSGGVAIVSGTAEAGRRRFTAAHEVGHHVFADDYATDLGVGEAHAGRERIIDAFAIHLLMPRDAVVADWRDLGGDEDRVAALLTLAVRYRVSWSAAVAHAATLALIPRTAVGALQAQRPSRTDLLEAGHVIVEEFQPPSIPQPFARAVLRAFRRSLLSADRAVELLRGAISEEDLPAEHDVPLDAYASELRPLV